MGRDLYLTRSWHRDSPESAYADAVSQRLANAGFRLIGHAQGHFGDFDLRRIRSLIESCAGFVAILPHRGGHKTSGEMKEEVQIASNLGKPALLITDDEVHDIPDYPPLTWWKSSELDPDLHLTADDRLTPAIESLIQAIVRTPRRCLYIAPQESFDTQFRNSTI